MSILAEQLNSIDLHESSLISNNTVPAELNTYNFNVIVGDQDFVKNYLIQKLNDNVETIKSDFITTMEILIKYVQLGYSFHKFFLMCETLPEEHIKVLEINSPGKYIDKQSIKLSSDKYLFSLCGKLFDFLKNYAVICSGDYDSKLTSKQIEALLGKVYPDVQDTERNKFVSILSLENILVCVKRLNRKDEALLQLCGKDLKSYRHTIVNQIVNLIEQRCSLTIERLSSPAQ